MPFRASWFAARCSPRRLTLLVVSFIDCITHLYLHLIGIIPADTAKRAGNSIEQPYLTNFWRAIQSSRPQLPWVNVCLFISYWDPAGDVSASLRVAQNARELQVGSSRENAARNASTDSDRRVGWCQGGPARTTRSISASDICS